MFRMPFLAARRMLRVHNKVIGEDFLMKLEEQSDVVEDKSEGIVRTRMRPQCSLNG